MSNRPIAIVIPHKNRLATLKAAVASIRERAGHPVEKLIVVDGGSSDGSREWLLDQDDVEFVPGPCESVAAAMNRGLERAVGCDVLRMHSDVVPVTDGWLRRMVERAETLDRCGILGGRLLFADGRISSEGRMFVTGLGIDDRHAYRKRFLQDDGREGGATEVDGVPGAFMFIRRSAIDAVGGFDEAYAPSRLDDDDFCLAARRFGLKVYATSDVRATHYSPEHGPVTRQFLVSRPEIDRVPVLRRLIEDAHAGYFREKWGFDPRHPDLSEIRRLYGDTEVTWRIGERMRFRPREWPPTVDAVMVTWNNREVLARCLDSLARTDYPRDRLRLIVSDNGSTDGTVEYLESIRESFPFEIEIHALKVNSGVAVGMNWAIVHGKGELVARLDDDVVLPENWLKDLVEAFRRRPYAGVVGPKIRNDNASRTIQCGPFRMYPFVYGHENEPDVGQADYFARVAHVRGCCNVYRRDVLEDVGLFDLRFSPSQFDDPDHHAALLAAGYEVLYEGRVGVVHALNSGAGRTYAALSNRDANQSKLYGKWGGRIWRTIELGIELSREGRVLPDDGDTSAFLARLPAGDAFPRRAAARLPEHARRMVREAGQRLEKILYGDEVLEEYFEDVREQVRSMRRDGVGWRALPLAETVVDVQPHRGWPLLQLALLHAENGEVGPAERLLAAARPICEDAEWTAAVEAALERARRGGEPGDLPVADRSAAIGEGRSAVPAAPRGWPRVLMVNTFEPRVAGGDMHQVNKTAEHLRRLGADVRVEYTLRPDPRGYDLIHAWNLWFPQQTLPQLKGLKVAAPDIPIVMTPIYWDMAEKAWADHAVPGIFEKARTREELDKRLAQLAADQYAVGNRLRSQAGEPNFAGYERYQREILELVDYLLPNSELEVRNLAQTLGVEKPYKVIHNGAEARVFDEATADLFIERYGLKDFVVTVGLVENRKNQLMLLYALRDAGVPVVVIGRNYDRRYFRLCKRFAPPNTLFIEHLPHVELASALKAARVFALPSWMECAAFANVEAALAGCALVVSDRTSEREYFGDDAYYCDPASVASIRQAVAAAWKNHEADAPKRERLKARFREQFTWEKAAEDTLSVYREVLAAAGSGGARERPAGAASERERVGGAMS